MCELPPTWCWICILAQSFNWISTSYSSFFHFNSCWLESLLPRHEQFQEPKADIDLLSAGLSPPIGEPWWTCLLDETWDLKLISTLLSASNPSSWRNKLFWDSFILREMFCVWALPHLMLILYICTIPELNFNILQLFLSFQRLLTQKPFVFTWTVPGTQGGDRCSKCGASPSNLRTLVNRSTLRNLRLDNFNPTFRFQTFILKKQSGRGITSWWERCSRCEFPPTWC